MPPFALIRPSTLPELLQALGEEQVPYCGGTELLLAMRAGLQRPAALVDIKRVPELTGVRLESNTLAIGAATSHTDVATHPVVRERFPMFAKVESAVGNARVRAQGSVGGNLCFAEPKSDVATALIALDASAVLATADGPQRTVPVEEFVVGAYEADKSPDELLVEVRLPLREGQQAVYCKYQTRERPTVGVAVVKDDRSCRLVVGAVGERPMTWMFGRPEEISAEDIAAEVDPIPDLTGSARYLKHVTEVYVQRALQALRSRGDHDDDV